MGISELFPITYPTISLKRFCCACISCIAYSSLMVKSIATSDDDDVLSLSSREEDFLPLFRFCTELACRQSRNMHLSFWFRPRPAIQRIKDDNVGFAVICCLVIVRGSIIWSSGCRPLSNAGFPNLFDQRPHVQILKIWRPPNTYLNHDHDDDFEIWLIISGILR